MSESARFGLYFLFLYAVSSFGVAFSVGALASSVRDALAIYSGRVNTKTRLYVSSRVGQEVLGLAAALGAASIAVSFLSVATGPYASGTPERVGALGAMTIALAVQSATRIATSVRLKR